jgi:protein-tyrosine phosphatase
MTNLLIVCMGNICRSPMAQAVFSKQLSDAGLSRQISVDSAGTHANRIGERPDPRAATALLRRGYSTGRIRSRRIEAEDFQKFDFVLAMDSDNLANLRESCPAEHLAKIKLFLDFDDLPNDTDVPDPYYGNAQGFERVLDLCESGVTGWIKRLR